MDKKPISKDYLVKQLQNYESQVIGKKYVLQEDGKGLFSGDYNDLINTPSIPNAYDDTALVEKVKGIENSLDNKADKTELHTHVNKDVLDNITSDKVTSWDNKATESFVTNAIAQAQLNGGEVDLSGLATIEQLNEKADINHKHAISDITDYESPDLSIYALKTEIPNVSNFVEKEEGKGLFSGSYNDLIDAPIINLVGTLNNTVIITTLSSGVYKIKGQYKITDSDVTTYLSVSGDLFIIDENYIKRITKDTINNYIVNNDIVTKETYATEEYINTKGYITSEETEVVIDNKINDKIQPISNEDIEKLF